MTLEDMTLDVEQRIEMKAAIGDVFRTVLHRFGAGNTNPKGESMQMILEQWPGGRWFRDRGNGIGHLWGHVQVIKPPGLMPDELNGVWKALADSTRRAILDLLRQGSRTTTEIVEAFPHLTRFGVLKHIDVLREAGLIL